MLEHFFQDKFRAGSKRERTFGILVDGVIHLVDREGRDALTARNIASVTGLSVGTFYNHFDTASTALSMAFECILKDVLAEANALDIGSRDAARRYVLTTRFVIERLTTKTAWGKVIRDGTLKLDGINPGLAGSIAEDVTLGLREGVFTIQPTPWLFVQLAELNWTSVRLQAVFGRNDQITRDTCEYGLRILGVEAEAASAKVAEVFRG